MAASERLKNSPCQVLGCGTDRRRAGPDLAPLFSGERLEFILAENSDHVAARDIEARKLFRHHEPEYGDYIAHYDSAQRAGDREVLIIRVGVSEDTSDRAGNGPAQEGADGPDVTVRLWGDLDVVRHSFVLWSTTPHTPKTNAFATTQH